MWRNQYGVNPSPVVFKHEPLEAIKKCGSLFVSVSSHWHTPTMRQMCLWLMAPEDDIVFKLERIGSAVAPSKGIRIQDIRKILA